MIEWRKPKDELPSMGKSVFYTLKGKKPILSGCRLEGTRTRYEEWLVSNAPSCFTFRDKEVRFWTYETDILNTLPKGE